MREDKTSTEPARKRGRPKSAGSHRKFLLRLPADLHRELRHYALDQGTSVTALLVEVVTNWWTKNKSQPNQPQK